MHFFYSYCRWISKADISSNRPIVQKFSSEEMDYLKQSAQQNVRPSSLALFYHRNFIYNFLHNKSQDPILLEVVRAIFLIGTVERAILIQEKSNFFGTNPEGL